MPCNKAISKQEVERLVSELSRFKMFNVVMDNGVEFGATEIVDHMENFLEFRRQFATSVFSDDALISIEKVADDKYRCITIPATYVISCFGKRDQVTDRKHRRWNEVADLMDLSYINPEMKLYIRELDLIVLPVDPAMLGNLTITEQAQIKRIINTYLDGKGRSMQMCRTVCFQVRLSDERNRIYAGIYDLERGRSITSKQIFEEYMSEDVSDDILVKCREFLSYAKTLEKI